jgi:hypothetical protein
VRKITIRQGTRNDSATVAEILSEAARWLDQSGMHMWRADELLPTHVTADVDAGLFFIAECDGAAAGVVKFLWFLVMNTGSTDNAA